MFNGMADSGGASGARDHAICARFLDRLARRVWLLFETGGFLVLYGARRSLFELTGELFYPGDESTAAVLRAAAALTA